jgi:hypothetical protein
MKALSRKLLGVIDAAEPRLREISAIESTKPILRLLALVSWARLGVKIQIGERQAWRKIGSGERAPQLLDSPSSWLSNRRVFGLTNFADAHTRSASTGNLKHLTIGRSHLKDSILIPKDFRGIFDFYCAVELEHKASRRMDLRVRETIPPETNVNPGFILLRCDAHHTFLSTVYSALRLLYRMAVISFDNWGGNGLSGAYGILFGFAK